MTADEILTAAAATMAQRGTDYDRPTGERTMEDAVRIFNRLSGNDALSEAEGWLFMIALKIARAKLNPQKVDTLVDLCAYTALYAECLLSKKEGPSDPANLARSTF